MSFNINGGAVGTQRTKLTNNTSTELFKARSRTIMLSITMVETAGATPNLTLGIYDPASTNYYFLRSAVAMTAGQAFIFNEPFELPSGWSIYSTSSAAGGGVDAHVSYINPVAAAGR